MAFAALTIDLQAKLAKFETDLARAGNSMDSLNRRASAMASNFSRAFGAAGIGLGVTGIAALAKSGIDAADALNDMSQRLGVSVKDLASFKLAAEQSGTSLDSVGAGIARLSKSIGQAEDGNKALAKALTDLGITARDPKEAFFQLADAVQRIEDPSKRAALLSQVLGKSYGELVPLLAQGSDELRKSAAASETFAESMSRLAPDADKFNDQLSAMKINAAGAAASLLTELVPAMNAVLENVRQAMRLSASGFGFMQLLGFGVNPTASPAQQLKDVNDELRTTEATVARLRKNSGGQDSSIGVLDARVKELQRLKAILLEQVVTAINAPPTRKQIPKLVGDLDFASALASKAAKATKPKLDEIDPFYRERTAALKAAADEIAETERLVREHLQGTEDVLRDQANAWTEAGKAIEEQFQTPLQELEGRLVYLDELMRRGVISVEAYGAAYADAFDKANATMSKTEKEMDTFAKTAAENIQNNFSAFLFDPFESGLDGMLQSFGSMIQKMIAEAVAADLAKWLFGDLIKGGSGGGVAGGLLKTIGGLFPSYAGGGYTGIGSRAGGVDGMGGFLSVLHPNETVVDHTKNQRSGHTIIVNVSGGSAPDVRRAAGQGAREALGMFSGAQRYA